MVDFSKIGESSPSFSMPQVSPESGFSKITKSASQCLKNLSFSSIRSSKWTYVILLGVGLGVLICKVFLRVIFKIKTEKNDEIAILRAQLSTERVKFSSLELTLRGEVSELVSAVSSAQCKHELASAGFENDLKQAQAESAGIKRHLDIFKRAVEGSNQFQLLVKQAELATLGEEISSLEESLRQSELQFATDLAPGTPKKTQADELKRSIESLKEDLNAKRNECVSLKEDIEILSREGLAAERAHLQEGSQPSELPILNRNSTSEV